MNYIMPTGEVIRSSPDPYVSTTHTLRTGETVSIFPTGVGYGDLRHRGEMYVFLDRKINSIENTLSYVSAFPLIGIVTGCIKVAVGVVQVIVAIVGAIFSFPDRNALNGLDPFTRALEHIGHGCGNIVAGTLEAIPLVGTGMYYLRQRAKNRVIDLSKVSMRHGCEDKWMPYRFIMDFDAQIIGTLEKIKEFGKVTPLEGRGWKAAAGRYDWENSLQYQA